jgi:NADPH:quinone reductase-like Zn-dependent oxidoreductase
MKAAVFDQFGDPAQVLQVRDVPQPPPPQSGQVRVRMLASPINPSDLLVVRGQYGKLPKLPATPGFEGVGIVEQNGGGLLGWRALGRRVAVIGGASGNWQEQVIIPSRQAVVIPSDLPTEQVACFFVNPATALAMVTKVLRVPPGAWLLQTAAGSAVGRMIIRLGKREGFRTINVVRRAETGEELRRLGADAIVDSSQQDVEGQVRTITSGEGVQYAIDAVGGATGSAVVRSLAPGGRMLIYGSLSFEPLQFDPRLLIVGEKRVEGFWLSVWARKQSPLKMFRLFGKISKLIREGVLVSEIGATFPLDDVKTAVARADEPGRTGKVLLQIGKE